MPLVGGGSLLYINHSCTPQGEINSHSNDSLRLLLIKKPYNRIMVSLISTNYSVYALLRLGKW